MKRNCNNCNKDYEADERNLKRGWGLCCSKSCASSLREKSKINYDKNRVEFNNYRRENWNNNILDKSMGDKCLCNVHKDCKYQGRTSEGYRIFDEVAYDEWGEEMFIVDDCDDDHPFSSSNFD